MRHSSFVEVRTNAVVFYIRRHRVGLVHDTPHSPQPSSQAVSISIILVSTEKTRALRYYNYYLLLLLLLTATATTTAAATASAAILLLLVAAPVLVYS